MKYGCALLLLLTAAPLHAQERQVFEDIRPGATITLKPDKAYILFRSYIPAGMTPMEPVFLREPGASEIAGYETARRAAFEAEKPKADRKRAEIIEANAVAARGGGKPKPVPPELTIDTFVFAYRGATNVVAARYDHAYAPGKVERLNLVEATPGTYVLLGVNNENAYELRSCLCFGTVSFTAAPGMITDMGYVLADRMEQVSTIPELRPVTGRKVGPVLLRTEVAIRPYAEGMPLPAALAGLPRAAADYRAVGKFHNKFAAFATRLVAMPGVLAYDTDRAIDLKAEPSRTSPTP